MQRSADNLDDLLHRGYRFALSLTHDAASADDLVQDAWLGLLKVRGPWTHGYLFAAIRNRFIDQCRREKLITVEPFEDHASKGLDGDGQLWSDDGMLVVEEGKLDLALGRLRPEERAVLLLAAVEGHTAREIGELLDCPRGTVLSLMHRARRKLRQWLQTGSGSRT